MKDTSFKLRSYAMADLASAYSPDVQARSAVRIMRDWINLNSDLCKELALHGYSSKQRYLTPLQVRTIVHYLGEPG